LPFGTPRRINFKDRAKKQLTLKIPEKVA